MLAETRNVDSNFINDYYRDKPKIPVWIKNALEHAGITLSTEKPFAAPEEYEGRKDPYTKIKSE